MPEISPLVIAGAVSGNSTAAIDLNSMIPELRQTVSRMGKVIMKDPTPMPLWNRRRRVVSKVEWHHDELFPRVGFIMTDLNRRAKNVVRFNNKRCTAEHWIKEGKLAITRTRLSCHGFRDNEVRLQLFSLAFNVDNFLRTLALPRKISQWTLTTIREKLIKIGAKVVRHAKCVTFQLAEVAIPRSLFVMIMDKIAQLRLKPETG